MIRAVALVAALVLPAVALACGKSQAAADTVAETEADTADSKADPAACAKRAHLVGKNCSYSTGLMSQRVLAEGNPWSYAGRLRAADNTLSSRVAAPFTVGPDRINVVANEVLEIILEHGHETERINLSGRVLEVGEHRYFVLTEFEVLPEPSDT